MSESKPKKQRVQFTFDERSLASEDTLPPSGRIVAGILAGKEWHETSPFCRSFFGSPSPVTDLPFKIIEVEGIPEGCAVVGDPETLRDLVLGRLDPEAIRTAVERGRLGFVCPDKSHK
ncbi:MAG: hypothetical protein HZC54_00755 [Verrucomicrobia bacterium]|nr:hypothetical protein [Verrucomicrobiota bacterium]